MDINYEIVLGYLKQAANLSDPLVMANLAIFYLQGVCGDKNVKKHLIYFMVQHAKMLP